jgi:hypothetical protein
VTTQTSARSVHLQDETDECTEQLLSLTEPPVDAAGVKTKVYRRVTV